MRKIPNVLYSLYSSSYASLRIADLLPETDLCDELKKILMEQCSIITGIMEGERFLDQDITDFISYCDEVAEQVEAMSAIQE